MDYIGRFKELEKKQKCYTVTAFVTYTILFIFSCLVFFWIAGFTVGLIGLMITIGRYIYYVKSFEPSQLEVFEPKYDDESIFQRVAKCLIYAFEVFWLTVGILLTLLRLWSIFTRWALDRNLTSFPSECPSAHIDGCTRVTLDQGCNRPFELENSNIIF